MGSDFISFLTTRAYVRSLTVLSSARTSMLSLDHPIQDTHIRVDITHSNNDDNSIRSPFQPWDGHLTSVISSSYSYFARQVLSLLYRGAGHLPVCCAIHYLPFLPLLCSLLQGTTFPRRPCQQPPRWLQPIGSTGVTLGVRGSENPGFLLYPQLCLGQYLLHTCDPFGSLGCLQLSGLN